MTTTTRRVTGAAAALAATLTLSATLATGVAAEPAPTTPASASQAAAHYVQEQLAAGGDFFSVELGDDTYPDPGVTADAILALAAAGTGQSQAEASTAHLAGDVVAYTGFGDPSEVYAGSVAKLLNVAVVQGLDPRSFGGTDLVATLEALEGADGRFSDDSAYGDYSNAFGQSLALIGLERAGAEPSAAAVAFLEAQQCPGGGFQLYLDDVPCTDDANSDPDATALAVQALIAVEGSATAVEAGLDFLAEVQGADGGVGGGAPQTAPNANSTGLAGQAFLAGGRAAEADLARAYVMDLQYGCEFPADLRGGIAYDPAAFAAAQAAGADARPVDQDRRSTTQAMLALAGTPLYAVSAQGASDAAPALSCETTPDTPPVVGPVIETDLPQPHPGARGLLR
jgi:hypothetical protein